MLPLKTNRQTLYETDYQQWIKTTVERLQSQDYVNVDWENLIEEIEDMGRSERRSFESNLIVVLLHLLKWQHQPECRSGSWESSIIEHRRRIKKALKESPSLMPYFESIIAECYAEALKQARAETGLPTEAFPTQCPYELLEVTDDGFLPQQC